MLFKAIYFRVNCYVHHFPDQSLPRLSFVTLSIQGLFQPVQTYCHFPSNPQLLLLEIFQCFLRGMLSSRLIHSISTFMTTFPKLVLTDFLGRKKFLYQINPEQVGYLITLWRAVTEVVDIIIYLSSRQSFSNSIANKTALSVSYYFFKALITFYGINFVPKRKFQKPVWQTASKYPKENFSKMHIKSCHLLA